MFAALSALLFGLYAFPYASGGAVQRGFRLYLAGYAELVGAVLRLFEADIHVSGTRVSGRTALEIVKTCDAMEVNILFAAAVLAFPASWRRKMVGLVSGLVALVFFNVVRITSLYFVALHYPAWFEVVHLEVWPLILVALAGGSFLLTVMWMTHGVALPGRPTALSET